MGYIGAEVGGTSQRSLMQNAMTDGGTRQEFNYSLSFFLFTHCSLHLHVCVAQQEAEFWQCLLSLLADEHLRNEMHPDTQGWFSPTLTPAGGHHDVITGGDEEWTEDVGGGREGMKEGAEEWA